MKKFLCLLLILSGLFIPNQTQAAGVANRREMMRQRREQMMLQQEQQIQEQMIQQKRQAYEQLHAQAMVRQQQATAEVQAYQQAAAQAMQNAVTEYKQQQAARQEQISAQQQAVYQYQQAAQQRAAQEQVLYAGIKQRAQDEAAYQQAYQQAALGQAQASIASSQLAAQLNLPPDEVIGIRQLWEELDITSEVWPEIMDREPKIMTIQRAIDLYTQDGVFIRKPAGHYVEMIDSMAYQNPQLLKNPLKDIVKMAAILEYDFENGQNLDKMIIAILGEDGYQRNLQRLGRQ